MSQLNLLKIENTIDPPGENNNETIHVPINDSFYAIVSGGEFYFYPYETSSTEQTFHETESSYIYLVDESPNDCMIGNDSSDMALERATCQTINPTMVTQEQEVFDQSLFNEEPWLNITTKGQTSPNTQVQSENLDTVICFPLQNLPPPFSKPTKCTLCNLTLPTTQDVKIHQQNAAIYCHPPLRRPKKCDHASHAWHAKLPSDKMVCDEKCPSSCQADIIHQQEKYSLSQVSSPTEPLLLQNDVKNTLLIANCDRLSDNDTFTNCEKLSEHDMFNISSLFSCEAQPETMQAAHPHVCCDIVDMTSLRFVAISAQIF